jgi:hypothetical protein
MSTVVTQVMLLVPEPDYGSELELEARRAIRARFSAAGTSIQLRPAGGVPKLTPAQLGGYAVGSDYLVFMTMPGDLVPTEIANAINGVLGRGKMVYHFDRAAHDLDRIRGLQGFTVMSATDTAVAYRAIRDYRAEAEARGR